MEILITNDDGIENEGIIELAAWAATLGDVIVVAPAKEQSGKSQSVNLKTDFRAWETTFPVKVKSAWAGDLSPADCVAFAYHMLGIRPDYVFSGINRGYNIGKEIAYSGTCGAVFEAAAHGIKAIAFSTRKPSLPVATGNLQRTWDYIHSNKLFDRCLVWNVNYPFKPADDMAMKEVRIGGTYMFDTFCALEDNLYHRERKHGPEKSAAPDTDIYTVEDGHIALSPLTLDRTDHRALGIH